MSRSTKLSVPIGFSDQNVMRLNYVQASHCLYDEKFVRNFIKFCLKYRKVWTDIGQYEIYSPTF